jgi:hypothetical protein
MPLLWLSLGFLGGILLASVLSLPGWAWLALAGGVLVVWIFAELIKRKLVARRGWARPAWLAVPLPVLLCALFLGGLRYQAAQPAIAPDFIAYYNDWQAEVTVIGVVAALPDERDTYTNLRLEVEGVLLPGAEQPRQVTGVVLARIPHLIQEFFGAAFHFYAPVSCRKG